MHNHMHFKHSISPALKPTSSQSKDPCTSAAASPIMAAFNAKTPYPHNHPAATEISNAIGEIICTDLLPYSMVENAGFNNLLKGVALRYKILSRTHFSRKDIPELNAEVHNKVKEALESMAGKFVHCTTDIWTSKFSTNAYLSLTGYWAMLSGEPEVTYKQATALLKLDVINEDHSAANIQEHIDKINHTWQTMVKKPFSVGYFVTDNAANMVKAMTNNGHIHCMAHCLHLVVSGALQVCLNLGHVIYAYRKMVGFFHRSNKATTKLHEIQEQLGLPQHAMIQDFSTRWNYSMYMLERVLEQKSALISIGTEIDLGGVPAFCIKLSNPTVSS